SGYLPRLALLVDRLFKGIGLSGRAVIPLTLGFGCDTMATLVSRTLETRRERIIATLLLALAIPCSAQLGVILSLLAAYPRALLVWVLFLGLVFLLVGYLTAQLLPGEGPSFYMEVPPLRLPQLGNVLTKTYTRMQWYFLEIVPLFVLASVLIWVGKVTGIFDVLVGALGTAVTYLGLPRAAGEAFLFGFFRRDYGAAGLYDLAVSGALSPRQLTVAAATLTLFVPCIAQFSMMVKERGWATALGMAAFIFPFAFVAGYGLNLVLALTGVLGG
ncbi:MAG TPA: ferrous iron transporter B, partial [Firmicutes bacterium]|nr:ferrous iron transporter B [Bacillota bacterium]